jgi:hypothetical protein
MNLLRGSIVVGAATVLFCSWKFDLRSLGRMRSDESPEYNSLQLKLESSDPKPPLMADNNSNLLIPRPCLKTNARDRAFSLLEHEIQRAALIQSEEGRRNALIGACLRWAEFDPSDALDLARKLGLDQPSDSLPEDIVQKWADKDYEAALTWANRESDGDRRDQMIARLAFVRAQTEPAAAAALVINQISSKSALEEASISVAHQWALRDLDGALAWVDRLPSGDLRARALNELALVANHRLVRNEPN